MESYTAGKSALSGDDTEEKITSSNDKGLRPLLAHYESLFSDFIIQEFSPEYMFRFVGLDGDDAKSRFEMRKLTSTWNEARAEQGQEAIEGPLGDAPINPTLLSAWQAEQQAQAAAEQEDFGTPPDGDAGDDMPLGEPSEDSPVAELGQPAGQPGGKPGAKPAAKPAGKPDFGKAGSDGKDFGKALGLPDIYSIET